MCQPCPSCPRFLPLALVPPSPALTLASSIPWGCRWHRRKRQEGGVSGPFYSVFEVRCLGHLSCTSLWVFHHVVIRPLSQHRRG